MPGRRTADMERALTTKGYKKLKSHHDMYWFYADEKKTSVRTRISHGETKYEEGLLRLVAKEMKLSRAELDRFMDCPMTYDEYLGLLRSKGEVK